MMEVCKRNGEGTFVGTRGNGRDAPIPAFHRDNGDLKSTRSSPLVPPTRSGAVVPEPSMVLTLPLTLMRSCITYQVT
jgi:hypothetical protein